MSLKSRIEKVEAILRGKDKSNLLPLVINWPESDGGPIAVKVPPGTIERLEQAYSK